MSKFPFIVDARKPEPASETIGFAPPEAASTAPALRPFRADERVLKSELPNVSNAAWTSFVFAMKVAPLDAVSPSNGLGMFDIRYKRLADLKLVENLRYKRDPITNRSVQVADWVPPLTRDLFLKSANAQYKVFVASCRAYYKLLKEAEHYDECALRPDFERPDDVSMSGALAILHRGGRAALEKWSDPENRFEATLELFRNANGVF
ncbi:MAG: hypothetical protein V4550_18465 [Gemmatimonadota bacterium]